MNQLKKYAVNFFSTTNTYKCDHFTRNYILFLIKISSFDVIDYYTMICQLKISIIYLLFTQIEFKNFVTN